MCLSSLLKVTSNNCTKWLALLCLMWVIWYKWCCAYSWGMYKSWKNRGVSVFWVQTQRSEKKGEKMPWVVLTSSHKKGRVKKRSSERETTDSEMKFKKKKKKRQLKFERRFLKNQLAAWLLSSQWWFSELCLQAFQRCSQSLGMKGWQEALPAFWWLSSNQETSGLVTETKKGGSRV